MAASDPAPENHENDEADKSAHADAPAAVISLPIERIGRDRYQARTHFDERGLAELADSITASGLVQPVVVRGTPGKGYTLIAGERRWRAAQRAGLAELPAIVRNDLAADEAAVFGLIENLQRESLGIMDTAYGLARLGEEHGLTHEAIARRIGKSRAYVSNFLRLRQLAPPVQSLLGNAELSLGHAKILAGVETSLQVTLARRAVAKNASVRQLERWIKNARPGDAQTARTTEPHAHGLAAIEQGLSEHLGNRVAIQYQAEQRRGEIRIAFHDLDEFEGLLDRIGYRLED